MMPRKKRSIKPQGPPLTYEDLRQMFLGGQLPIEVEFLHGKPGDNDRIYAIVTLTEIASEAEESLGIVEFNHIDVISRGEGIEAYFTDEKDPRLGIAYPLPGELFRLPEKKEED